MVVPIVMTRSLYQFQFVTAYYLQQCLPDEQYLNECLRDSGNKLIHYLRQGIPELDIYEVTPQAFTNLEGIALNG